MKKRVGLVLVMAIAGCATPYQEMGWRGGYDQSHLGPGMWSVRVEVNAHTSAGTALEYAYRRAGELCGSMEFDVLDGTQAHRDNYVVTNNVVTNYQKTDISIIVRCRSHAITRPRPGGSARA